MRFAGTVFIFGAAYDPSEKVPSDVQLSSSAQQLDSRGPSVSQHVVVVVADLPADVAACLSHLFLGIGRAALVRQHQHSASAWAATAAGCRRESDAPYGFANRLARADES